MASLKYLVHIDLNQNELQNATIQNVTSAPTVPTPLEGQLYFNSTSHLAYVHNGTTWVNIMSQGTTYTVGDNGLTRKNFTVALHDKLVALKTQADTNTALALLAPKANPIFTGTIQIPNVANVSTAIVANSNKTGITSAQAGEITVNTAKTGITNAQATAISTNSNKNSYPTADATKVGRITVTQAVNLDNMEADIAALANGMVYKGNWDASGGSFPGGGSAQIGWFYYVSVTGTVNGVVFKAGDNIVAIVDNASTSTFASNWSQHDNTDSVQSVVGLVGSITKSALLSAINVTDGAKPDQDLSGLAPKANPTFSGTIVTPNFTNLDVTLAGIASNTSAISSNDTDIAANTTLANARLVKASNLSDLANAGTARTNIGLGNVANENRATILSGNLTGTIGGVSNADITSGAAKGKTSNQDSTATILSGNLTGKVNNVAVATVTAGAILGASANQDLTSAIQAGTTKSDVGLNLVNNIAVTGSNTGDETKTRVNALAITTVGTITSGSWNATSIPTSKTAAKVTALVAGAAIDVSNSGVGSVTVSAETATISNPGVVALATVDEALTGRNATKAVTAAGLAARTYRTAVGNGTLTTIPVTHGLKTQDVMVQLYDASTLDTVYAEVERTSTTVVNLKFNKAPLLNRIIVLIQKIG